MLRVPIAHARPGMVLAMAVLHPQRSNTTLLKAGVELSDSVVGRLREIGCRDLWIHYPGLEEIGRYVNPAVYAAHGRLASHVGEAFAKVLEQSDATLEFKPFDDSVGALLATLLEDPTANLYLYELGETDLPGLRHASGVCLLSMLMGLKLEFYLADQRGRLTAQQARDVTPLGVGAIFHDIGALALPAEVRERFARTGNDNDPEWQQHVQMGYAMVRGELHPAASAVVLHHHQRFDGTGYPARRSPTGIASSVVGEHIHIFARVAAVADMFQRLVERPGVPAVRALGLLQQKPFTDWFDPIVMKALMNVVPPYAPGTLVTLNDRRRGVVVAWTPKAPCRPTVELLPSPAIARNNEYAERERIDLREHPEVSVAFAGGEHVEPYNYECEPGAFDLIAVRRAMINRADELTAQQVASAG